MIVSLLMCQNTSGVSCCFRVTVSVLYCLMVTTSLHCVVHSPAFDPSDPHQSNLTPSTVHSHSGFFSSSSQDGGRDDAACRGSQNMDRLVELLDSMRSNSSGVEQRLASFMEEAQSSARSEETLAQVVGAIYSTAVSDRSFATTAARLCEKMALFMVEGTKFRSLLLNMLQVRESCPTVCL